MDNKKIKINEWPRHGIQALWAALTNSHVSGFVTGKIYTGKLKNVCVPGLNCYSCPGATGACPIGSFQAVIGSWNFKMAYYIVGFLIFIGALLGRLICGFLCPFGLIQDLLNKIPFPKKIRTFRGDKLLRKLKYVILLVFVVLMPLFVVDIMGQGSPYFCKLICPAGTLEGGLPLVLLNKSMRSAVGWLYVWKNTILVITIVLSIIIYRPFCKYICPLGAFYSVFNKVFVVLMPLFVVDIMGQGSPYFCKLICPAGTLEGGLPLVLLNKSMRSAVGWLYVWKNTILVITIVLSIIIYRPFCKYICPLGAFYSVFNKVSVFRYRVDAEKCVHCGKCAKACQMEVNPVENPNSLECIRCGRCKKICPTQAIQCGTKRK